MAGTHIGVDSEGQTVVMVLEKGALMAGRARGGALADGQGKWLADRFTSPLMPQVLVLSPAGAITGLGALSDGAMGGIVARVSATLSLPESSLLFLSEGEDATLVAADPIAQGAGRAMRAVGAEGVEEGVHFPGWVKAFETPFMSTGATFKTAGLLLGLLAEGLNRHVVLVTDFPLTQTELSKVLRPLARDLMMLTRTKGVDTSADSVVLVSTGKAELSLSLPSADRIAMVTRAFDVVMKGLLREAGLLRGWRHPVQIEGAQSDEELSALVTAFSDALQALTRSHETTEEGEDTDVPSWSDASRLLRRFIARAPVETLAAEDLTWIVDDVVLADEGKVAHSADAERAWAAFWRGKTTLRWQLHRGGAQTMLWL